MKRIIATLLVLVMVISLAACSNTSSSQSESNSENGTNENTNQTQNSTNHSQNVDQTEGSTQQTGNNTQQTEGSTEQTKDNSGQTEDNSQTENDAGQSDMEEQFVLDADALTNQLNKIRLQNNVVGMAVAVTDGEKVIYNQGFGIDNLNHANSATSKDSVFRIASVSKTYTAIVIMALCDEGILDLDTPIKTYIPSIQFSKQEATDKMTLRHLLTHTGGMPADDYMKAGSEVESTMNSVILSTLPTLKLSSLPGEGKYQYSTWGYNLIGCVASTVTGKTLSQLVSEYVSNPLGMDATTFDYKVAANSKYPLSAPHITSGGKLVVDKLLINTAFNAGAGLYSNTADLCRLSRFFLNGGVSDSGKRILSEDAFKELKSMHAVRSNTSYYGFGLIFSEIDDGYMYGHTGSYYGQNYYCSFFVDENTGYGVTILMNSKPTDKNIRYTVPEMIFGMLNK